MAELLAPAGNYEKLEAAVLYGADAVYLAGTAFGMRAAADNFTPEEMKRGIAFAHGHGVKVYVTVNVMPRESDYPALSQYLEELGKIGPDALIVADVGVLALARQILPQMELHISTQANTVSSATCRAWQALGAKRVVLARELTLEEIRQIRKNTPDDLELECFIHGSMCISYSGRCLLSNFLVERDANRGGCAQPCRWNYTARPVSWEIREEKRPDIPLELSEEGGETFVMSSKDLCMIEHVPELLESGISSFKIEGRMKSAYYTAVVTNAYRMAMDAAMAGNLTPDPAWMGEVESVSHREYATGYFFADSHTDARTVTQPGYLREKAYLATVLSYDMTTGEALCVQRNKYTLGEGAQLLTPGKVGQKVAITALYDETHGSIPATPHPGMRFYAQLSIPAKAGDILRGDSE